jgi:hypothetical protein
MTKRKSPKHNTKIENEPKTRNQLNRSEEDWRHIAQMLKEANLDSIEEFYINTEIPSTTFYDAIKKHTFMAEAHQIAKTKIGIKDEKICKKHFLGMNTVIANGLPDYLPRWKSNFEWRAQLKNAVDTANWAKVKELMDAANKAY